MRFSIPFVEYKDKLYTVERQIKESSLSINENSSVNDLIEYFRCDKILKKDGFYFFCKEVMDTEIIIDNDD